MRAVSRVSVALALAAGCASGGPPQAFLQPSPPDFPDGGFPDDAGAPSNPPTLPPTVTATVPPPPISGGTLLVAYEQNIAVAADPDRDVVYGVDLTAGKLLYTVALNPGDEPGRVVEDRGNQLAHVALRGGGALLTIDERTGAVIARRDVCPAPRGVAWDWATDRVWVACATGELVAFPSKGGPAVQRWVIERDLRDVLFDADDRLVVTKFRSAEILHIGADGAITSRFTPQAFPGTSTHVMWRALTTFDGLILAVHQAESVSLVQTQQQGGYGGGCGQDVFATTAQSLPPQSFDPDAGDAGAPPPPPPPTFDDEAGSPCPPPIVTAQYSVMDTAGNPKFAAEFAGVLPVDIALSRDGRTVAIVAPGNAYSAGLSSCFTAGVPPGTTPYDSYYGEVTGQGQLVDPNGWGRQPIAVAFDAKGDLVLQSREPAGLWVKTTLGGMVHPMIPLSSQTRRDTGHDVFHTQAGALIACASCHPEGGDDGHVWQLDGDLRRTPSLRGTILGTAPYHWPGDEPNLVALTNDVYTKRMDGVPLDGAQMIALSAWVDRIPAPPAPSWIDAAAAARGKAIFYRGDAQCSACHSGPKLTNNLTLNVGTGGNFQVPPLVGVGWNTPLMHDGCAATILDRFGKCATREHGLTQSLSAQDISDLATYLETL